MTIILDNCVCVCAPNFNTIKNEMRVPVHIGQRKILCTCVYDFTIRYGSCTDGVVYLVCCIYDKYEILLYSLEYVLLLVPIHQQCKQVMKIGQVELGADLTTVLTVLFKYCYKYCYSDSRKL